MPDFAYVARDPQGQKVTGVLSAGSEREVLSMLSNKSLFPIQIATEKAKGSSPLSRKRASAQVMANTYNQLAALLRSGVPLLRSINVIRQQTSHLGLKEILDDVYRRVEDGTPLAEAMGRYPRIFSDMAINMVRAGSEGGFLEDALDRVAQFTEQQQDLKSRTAGALAYPIFLAVVGSLVVGGLVIFFVPRFGGMFDGLRQRNELPAFTDWLLWISTTLRSYGLVIVGLAACLGLYLRQQLKTDAGRRMRDLCKLRMPLLGVVFSNLAVARFCRVLGTLLHNGVPILKSLEISREATGNRVLSEAVAKASENISSGQSLAKPLASCKDFPPSVVEMIAVAQESNTLDRVLVDIADGLERRTSRQLDLAVRLLEPIMLLILAAVVLFVVIALLLPVLKMSSTMRK